MEQKKNLPADNSIKPLIKLVLDIQLEILHHLLMQNLWHDVSEARFVKQKIKNNKDKEFYTTEEVMELLRVSRKTLYSYRKVGKIRSIKTENTIRFSKEDIDCFKDGSVE